VYFITVNGKQISELEKEEVKMLSEKQGKMLSHKRLISLRANQNK